MKHITLLHITILSTLILFSACSDSQNRIKKESSNKNVSIYNIMGISKAKKHASMNYNKELNPLQENMTNDITYISYRKTDTYPQISGEKNYFFKRKIETINEIENKAKSFLGVPYVWGATGPSKFDCSGFTQWVYRDSGINIPRVSRDQARVGQFVSYGDLQRGDMVFFDTKKKRTGIVSHVGIYLGNGDFIHASSAGKSVVIYNFDEKKFYKKRFLWGRRVLNTDFHYALN